MNKVLITGATGFIGRRLVDRLVKDEIQIVHIAPTVELAHQLDGQARGVVCGLGDLAGLCDSLREERFEVFYHLAWDGVSTDFKNDYKRQYSNVIYGVNACKLANDIGCSHVVIPGSASEYAYSQDPIDGSGMPCPADAYGAAKASTRIACDLFARQMGLSVNWLLVSSIYGPGRYDANIISYSIRAFLDGERPSFTALEQVWDYLYIDDLIEALYLVGEYGKTSRVYAIGSGESRPLRDYVEAIRDAIDPGAEMGIGEVPYKTKHIDNSVVDIEKISQDVGFTPRVSFEEGIDRTIESFCAAYKRNRDGKIR